MGKLRGALHRSIAQKHCTALRGDVAQGREMGSPTTDPIPIPAPAQPQVRIIAAETGNARVPVRLSCYIWGFYPPEVTVIWLHNGDIAEPDDYNPISAIPNGDWTYQTQVSLLVAPVAGDTYTYSVQHVSLQEPLLEDWSEWRGAGPHPEAGGLGSLLPLTRPCPRRSWTDAGGDDTGGGGHWADGAGTWLISHRRLPLQGQASCPRQHLRTPRRTPPGTGGSRLAPSQTRCCGADNKDAPQAPLVSLQCSVHWAEGHTLLHCLTKGIGCAGAMAWDPKGPWGTSGTALLAGRGKGSSRSARPAAASPRALRAAVDTAADEERETVREPPREGYEDGEGSAGQGV
uniref:Ig-like domain-containing protein n=1 Tax=Anas platyrhynchos platyrhynchos TaxID=8840 RepID=A0A493TNH9_ANAPP